MHQVQDHGIGINPFERERVLMPFFRSEKQAVRDEQGRGRAWQLRRSLLNKWVARWDLKACIVRVVLSGFPYVLLKLIAIGILGRSEQLDHHEMYIGNDMAEEVAV